MVELVDGPCAAHYMLRRAPLFVRAVQKISLFDMEEADVLDMPEDMAAPDEKIFVYQRDGGVGSIHIHGRRSDREKIGGWWAIAKYKYVPDVDGEPLRDNGRWIQWVFERCRELGIELNPDGSIKS